MPDDTPPTNAFARLAAASRIAAARRLPESSLTDANLAPAAAEPDHEAAPVENQAETPAPAPAAAAQTTQSQAQATDLVIAGADTAGTQLMAAELDNSAAPALPERSSVVHVLKSTSVGRFDQVFAGVAGSLGARGEFRIDPIYKQLAYVFTLAEAGTLPAILPNTPTLQADPETAAIARAENVVPVAVVSGGETAFKANLVEMVSRGWDKLYDDVASMLPGGAFGNSMLQAEKRNVANNVANYLGDTQLPQWDVPVVYSVQVDAEDPGQRGTTERALLAQAGSLLNITVGQMVAVPHVAPTAHAQSDDAALPATMANHQGGLRLTVEGVLTLRALDAAQAVSLAHSLLDGAAHVPAIRANLVPTPSSIQHCEYLEPEPNEYDGMGYRD